MVYSSVLKILLSDAGKALPLRIATHGRKYARTFTGSNLIDVLLYRFNLPGGRAEAIQAATMLLKLQLFSHRTLDNSRKGSKDVLFVDSDKALYQFQADSRNYGMVLNSHRIWNDRVDTNVLGTVQYCKSLLDKLLDKHTDGNARVDYDSARADPAFLAFEEATCEFQRVDLGSMDDRTKTAFCINLYNMMIKHAFVKKGIPRTMLSRISFFSKVKCNIGGHLFSFNDLEGGILRANSRQPYTFSKPFGSSDPRRSFALSEMDPRIHFALNCGASSCPLVKNFSARALDQELEMVVQAFCEDPSNLHISADGNTVFISKIFDWYEGDFGDSKQARLLRIASWLRGNKQRQLEAIARRSGVRIRRLPYDWSSDATDSSASFGSVDQTRRSCACVIL